MKQNRKTQWWLAYPTALLLLVLLDLVLGFWRPFPSRLPDQFSPGYLSLVLQDAPRDKPTIVVLGDSVLWGYKLDGNKIAVESLRKRFPNVEFLNLSYEGGSVVNSEVMLRAVLASGIDLVGIVANVNSKEFSSADSAYSTLHPSLEQYEYAGLSSSDLKILTTHHATDLNAKFGGFVERYWRLYRLRTDIRERLFGHDDLAGALLAWVQDVTGAAATQEKMHRPTADRFLGTYDLSAISATNVEMQYYRKLLSEVCLRRIPTFLFLTPTNHALLHDYIDAPEYDQNLTRLRDVPHCASVAIANFDRMNPAVEFIDNDHLTESGQRRLADALAAPIGKLLR